MSGFTANWVRIKSSQERLEAHRAANREYMSSRKEKARLRQVELKSRAFLAHYPDWEQIIDDEIDRVILISRIGLEGAILSYEAIAATLGEQLGVSMTKQAVHRRFKIIEEQLTKS